MEQDTIVFVYNADSGLLNSAKDYLHKIVSPKTYSCNLCAITYGNAGMDNEWKKFIKGLPLPYEFLHKDELSRKFRLNEELPAIFMKSNGKLKILVAAKEINSCKTVDELIDLVKDKV